MKVRVSIVTERERERDLVKKGIGKRVDEQRDLSMAHQLQCCFSVEKQRIITSFWIWDHLKYHTAILFKTEL